MGAGADVNAKTEDGSTPPHNLLQECEKYGYIKLIDIPSNFWSNMDLMSKRKRFTIISFHLIFCANFTGNSEYNLVDLVKLFIESGTDVNGKTRISQNTPLHLLCRNYKNGITAT